MSNILISTEDFKVEVSETEFEGYAKDDIECDCEEEEEEEDLDKKIKSLTNLRDMLKDIIREDENFSDFKERRKKMSEKEKTDELLNVLKAVSKNL